MYDFLENNLLIITPSSYKREILKYLTENKKILNIKFMTIEEYIKKIKFDIDEKTINYLVKSGMKVENAITFLNNLLYIEDKNYNNEKLDYLVSLKRELDERNLLIYDNLFKKILTRYKIIIYGYGNIDNWKKSLFDNYKLIDYAKKQDKFEIFYVEKIEDEVEMVFQKIINLLNQGIDINKISLMNVDKEYFPLLKRYSFMYQIPINIDNPDTLYGTIIGQDFYQMILDNLSFKDIFSNLLKYQDNVLYGVIVNILNKYVEFEIKDIHEQIKYELLHTKISSKKYENVIRIKNVFDSVRDDEYIFLLGFNNELIPKLNLDIDYITDNIKDFVHLEKTEEINRLSKENTLNYLKSINHLVISYKKNSSFNSYYPSILLDNMDCEIKEYRRSLKYSNMANRYLYTKYLDDYNKYGIKNDNIDLLYNNYGENDYLKYNNEFDKLDKNNLLDFLENKLTLSYSSIDNYYKCGFKYFLNDLLKVNLFEETFMTIVGSLFHEVLRHMNDTDFQLDFYYEKYLKDKVFSNKEMFFIEKLKKDLEYVIETIKKHQFISGFNKMLYEEKIDITLKNSPYVHFKGFVDKIMYKKKDNETLVSIIDYKTGNPDIKINHLEFGLSMQLPIYLYLVKNSDKLENIKFAGFYLQHILNVDIKKDKKSYEEQKYDNLKLTGYTTDNIERLAIFDSTYENSEMIKGIKLGKNGELPSNKKVSDEMIEEIISQVEKKIIEAMDKILEGDFSINPKIIDGKNMSCEFCSFKDVCYLEEKNKIYINTKDFSLEEMEEEE